MNAIGLLFGLVFALGLVFLVWASLRSYRRKKRIAQARHRAALNTLLAEADELAQKAKREADPGSEPQKPVP